MSTPKRCLYDVLGLPRACTQDEIRSAYKKLALQRHPDKLVQSGLSSEDATAAFQELVHAYEVLSDPKERSWYDSHRSQILFSSVSSDSDSLSPIPDLFSYFSPSCYTDYTNPKAGFFKVYGDVFNKVYANEVTYARKMDLSLGLLKEAPLIGDLDSDYNQVNAFYGYWLGFCTVMDFGWVGKWHAAAGLNRKSRRVMEEENKKLRKKVKKEYNETVRGLAEFVKKRDKRVIDMIVKKEKEKEKKREEETVKRKEREREREREKSERARMYEEPKWARVDEVEEFEELEEDGMEGKGEQKKELYCVACGKKFKSEKQWKNHEQSKKHKEKVAELRKSFVEEEDILEDIEEVGGNEAEAQQGMEGNDGYKNDVDCDGFVSAEDGVNELEERFQDSVGLEEGLSRDELHSDDEDGVDNVEIPKGVAKSVGSDDDSSFLEAMIFGRRNRKHYTVKNQAKGSYETSHVESEDETESMDYNNRKGKKKSRRSKKNKGKVLNAEATKGGDDDGDGNGNVQGQEHNRVNGFSTANGADDDPSNHETQTNTKAGKQTVERMSTSWRDADTKPKNASKGRKQTEKLKNYASVCEKCGEEFDSRNKLHKHLTETGHASLKSR